MWSGICNAIIKFVAMILPPDRLWLPCRSWITNFYSTLSIILQQYIIKSVVCVKTFLRFARKLVAISILLLFVCGHFQRQKKDCTGFVYLPEVIKFIWRWAQCCRQCHWVQEKGGLQWSNPPLSVMAIQSYPSASTSCVRLAAGWTAFSMTAAKWLMSGDTLFR